MNTFEINEQTQDFSYILLKDNNQDTLSKELNEFLKNNPSAPTTPIIIDSLVEQELIEIIQLFISFDLQPIAVIDGVLTEQAQDIQFPVLNKNLSYPTLAHTAQQEHIQKNHVLQVSETKTECENVQPVKTQLSIQNTMLRTGQILTQKQGDVVVTATVNAGSEIITSGNIYIFGHARGRLLAGTPDNSQAHIFCSSLEAEMVAIAGVHCLADDMPRHLLGRAVHIQLNEQQELVFNAITV